MREPTVVELRLGTLAVSVVHDVDLEPAAQGVVLPGAPPVEVSWDECRTALAGHHPGTPAGRVRLAAWVLARRWAADAGPEALRAALRPVGLPVGHLVHPGAGWVRERVLGGALDLGLGAVGLDPDAPDRVVLLPVPALEDAGLDPAQAWTRARAHLERLGAEAAELVLRDAKGHLRPCGDADAVTLLGARSLRTALAEPAGGLVGAVVPTRRLGWTRLSAVDPAFGPAAAAATPASDRGFSRGVLVTADEVTLVREGGDLARLVVDDADRGRRRSPGDRTR